ncbi:MAG: hypothetical protein NXY57DRAFT_1041064 [Lentinula lateritia]|nr:MAG: hypothetical protein NXY57DRAFT_1041064 [Lentinula lateritia]
MASSVVKNEFFSTLHSSTSVPAYIISSGVIEQEFFRKGYGKGSYFCVTTPERVLTVRRACGNDFCLLEKVHTPREKAGVMIRAHRVLVDGLTRLLFMTSLKDLESSKELGEENLATAVPWKKDNVFPKPEGDDNIDVEVLKENEGYVMEPKSRSDQVVLDTMLDAGNDNIFGGPITSQSSAVGTKISKVEIPPSSKASTFSFDTLFPVLILSVKPFPIDITSTFHLRLSIHAYLPGIEDENVVDEEEEHMDGDLLHPRPEVIGNDETDVSEAKASADARSIESFEIIMKDRNRRAKVKSTDRDDAVVFTKEKQADKNPTTLNAVADAAGAAKKRPSNRLARFPSDISESSTKKSVKNASGFSLPSLTELTGEWFRRLESDSDVFMYTQVPGRLVQFIMSVIEE